MDGWIEIYLCVLCELISGDVVNREDDLDVALLSLGNQACYLL